MPFNFQVLVKGLQGILDEHEDHLDEAQGFGLRVAASLMPYAEARRIVDSFDKDTRAIRNFRNKLNNVGLVPPGFEEQYKKLLATTDAAITKFEVDRDKALKALEQHEDRLVGKSFQVAFERIRLDILKLDPLDDIDLDYKTELYMEATPSYAVGIIHIKRGGADVYRVNMGYQADGDFYYGNLYSAKTAKAYKRIVQKNGSANLIKFSAGLVGQVKALADFEGTKVFKSRKRIDLEIVDPDILIKEIEPALMKKYEQIHPNIPGRVKFEFSSIDTMGTSGKARTRWDYQWDYKSPADNLGDLMSSKAETLDKFKTKMQQPFEFKDARNRVWVATPIILHWRYRLRAANNKDVGSLPHARGLLDVWEKNKDQIIKFVFDGSVEYTLTRKDIASKTSSMASKIAARWLNAGASSFEEYVEIPDLRRAYDTAVEEARRIYGDNGYNGTISTTSGAKVRQNEPFTDMKELHHFVNQDIDRADKYGPAFAVPFAKPKVLKEESVTVTIKAKTDAEATRKANLMIKAQGRIPPKASILVDIKTLKKNPDGTYTVTGTRQQALLGQITGWYFYGWAST